MEIRLAHIFHCIFKVGFSLLGDPALLPIHNSLCRTQFIAISIFCIFNNKSSQKKCEVLKKKFTSWQLPQLFPFERTTISLQYELFFWLEEWLSHAILEEYFLEAFSSWVPFLPEQFRFYSLDKEDNAKTIRTGLGQTWNMSQVALV